MRNLVKFKDYSPEDEYKVDTRREINLDAIRRSKQYQRILDLGFSETTSHQQELNNTLKFVRTKRKQKQSGHSDVFYTIHPSGIVRRYNPMVSKDVPEGEGNDIKNFHSPFRNSKDYLKALNYLWTYLQRKAQKKDFR